MVYAAIFTITLTKDLPRDYAVTLRVKLLARTKQKLCTEFLAALDYR